MGSQYGRRSASGLPQIDTSVEPEEKTITETVDEQMPKIIEVIGLDPFEAAIVRNSLINSLQKQKELRILQLPAEENRKALIKLIDEQKNELKNSLPEEKYQAYMEMLKDPYKAERVKKREKRKEKKRRTKLT